MKRMLGAAVLTVGKRRVERYPGMMMRVAAAAAVLTAALERRKRVDTRWV